MAKKTRITLTEFQTAPKGSGIKDSHGRIWEFKDEPQEVQDKDIWRTMQCPGYEEELIQHCRHYPGGPHLIDEEHAILLELNHSSVKLVK